MERSSWVYLIEKELHISLNSLYYSQIPVGEGYS